MENYTENAWHKTVIELAPVSEKFGRLHPKMLELAYQENWFKLFVPQVYGGPGKKLPEILRLEEQLASLDGSLAWTVTLCSGAAWFAGFLDPELAKEVFANREVCFAGSGAVGGTAVKTQSGYLINGDWKYASGALHATIFTANCAMKNEDGSDILDENGVPLVNSFILKKEEVNILSSWSYFGLVATGSHAFEVKNVEVPFNRSFKINNNIKVADQGFNYPFLQLSETTLAVNSLGMALHFVALVEEYFYGRSGLKRFSEEQVAFFNTELARCAAELNSLRLAFYTVFDQSWDELINKETITETSLAAVSRLSRELAHKARVIVDTLYPYCGLEAAKKESELNRVWRDLHTASQHTLLTFK